MQWHASASILARLVARAFAQPAAARRATWLASLLGRDGSAAPQPPSYPRRPRSVQLGSVQLVDEFGWLADYEAAAPYLARERAYLQHTARRWAPLAQALRAELKQALAATQADDPPEAVGSWSYWTRHNPHGQDTLLRSCGARGHEQVLASADGLQQDAARISTELGVAVDGSALASLKLSADQQLMAFSLPLANGSGEEACCAAVKDLRTGQLLPDGFLPRVDTFEWSADGSCLYFVVPDAAGRPSQVFRRALGGRGQQQRGASDALLFEEHDGQHFVSLTRSKDWRYVVINSHAKLSSEVHLLDAHSRTAAPVCVAPRRPGCEYFVEHHEGHLLILSNLSQEQEQPQQQPQQQQAQQVQPAGASEPDADAAAEAAAAGAEARDYALYTLPVAALTRAAEHGAGGAAWRLLLPEQPGSAVTDMDAFSGCVLLHMHAEGRPALRLLRLSSNGGEAGLRVTHQQQVRLPDWALWVRPGMNLDHHARAARLHLSSPAVPERAFELHLGSGQLSPLRPEGAHPQQPAAPGTARHLQQRPQPQPLLPRLSCERLWAPAADGTRVPLTLLRPAERSAAPGPAPLLVEVYGAYGHLLEADFKSHRLPLLQRGWSVALAHVRGGGELGRRWHAAGRQLHKRNSVTDLLACLQHLVDRGVARPGCIAGHAASAGALTLAAAINARPAWFAAAVLEAPFLDLVAGCGGGGSEAGGGAPGHDLLVAHEVDEWGDARACPAVARRVAALCPYTNVDARRARYPALLLTAGLADSRVPFWMPAKFVAKLRAQAAEADAGDAPLVLLDWAEHGGHFSGGLLGGCLDDAAAQQAFLVRHTPA